MEHPDYDSLRYFGPITVNIKCFILFLVSLCQTGKTDLRV